MIKFLAILELENEVYLISGALENKGSDCFIQLDLLHLFPLLALKIDRINFALLHSFLSAMFYPFLSESVWLDFVLEKRERKPK